MKFLCEQCRAKYSIDDARVRGKVLKIRCKQCSHVITVREETAAKVTGPTPLIGSGPSPVLDRALASSFASVGGIDEATMISSPIDVASLPGRSSEEWFVSFDGEQEGPLSLELAAQRARVELGRGKEAHAWRDGFDGWLPVSRVPELQRLLQPKPPARPPLPPAQARAIGRESGKQPAMRGAPAGAKPAQRDPGRPSPSLPVSRPSRPELPATMLDMAAPQVSSPIVASGRTSAAAARAPAVMEPAPLPAPPVPEHAHAVPTPAPSKAMPLGEPLPPIPSAPSRGGPAGRALPATGRATGQVPLVPPIGRGTGSVPATGRSTGQVPLVAPSGRATGSVPVPAVGRGTGPTPTLPSRGRGTGPTPTLPSSGRGTGPTPTLPGSVPSSAASAGDWLPAAPEPPRAPPSAELVISDSGVKPLPPPPMMAPPPVVIIGSGSVGGSGWLKWAAIAGGVVIIGLLGVVGYLLTRKPPQVVAALDPPAVPAGKRVDDPPVKVVDPGPRPTAPPVAPPTAPIAHAERNPGKSHSSHGPTKLSSSQSALASLYGESEKAPARELPQVQPAQHAAVQFNEQQIAEVVRKNKQSLTICYERVLKRDQSLKNARVDVNVKVGISGSVTNVQIGEAYSGSEIGGCLSMAIRRWRFPSTGEEYSVPFPLLLQAQ